MKLPPAPPPDAFLEDRHLALADRARVFGEQRLRATAQDESHAAARTREIVSGLASAGLLRFAVAPPHGAMDLRSLVAIREQLAYFSSLADTAFAMQGLGSHVVSRAGTDVQKNRWLPAIAGGDLLAAFAVTEPEAGSDLAGVRTRATADGAVWRLRGVKTFISNAGIAGMYTVLARTGEGAEHRGLSMFLVDAEAPGIAVKPLEPMAPHPLGEVRFEGTPAVLLGQESEGYRLALSTLEVFRPSVGAAACGLAARALEEAVRWSQARRQFGRALADFQATQMALAEMHVDLEAARLLVRRAAWLKDRGAEKITAEGAAAKLFATEAAQRVVDRAVQIHGGQGVMRGATVERLYREVRALRIYEGTSEIQKLVIARQILKESK
ncbi:MAG TPA: acyl-CoA dehydrogenase family protein [Vicinamibacteria bacterium]|jgi:acyl-CoA dehydrogenase|nr:acyl-CoA dehydrogenase family protein [Vicinamibacteria bacterium]